MAAPALGSNSLGPQIVTASQPAQNAALVEIITTPAGAATTLVSLCYEFDFISGFSETDTNGGIVLEMFDPFGNLVFAHAVRVPHANEDGVNYFPFTVTLAAGPVFTDNTVTESDADGIIMLNTTNPTALGWWATQAIPPITLPPNCLIRLRVVAQNDIANLWFWNGIVARLDFTEAAAGDAGNDIPLLTPILLEQQIAQGG